jgi:hypothetical protein
VAADPPQPGPPRLWGIGYALAACFFVALAGLAALWAVALVLLHHPALPRAHMIPVHDTVGVAQLVFASVAGAGALVALVVAYRRQRVGEITVCPADTLAAARLPSPSPQGSRHGGKPRPGRGLPVSADAGTWRRLHRPGVRSR